MMRLIDINEIATYVVCPEAWRLKHLKQKETPRFTQTAQARESKQLREEWTKKQDLSVILKKYSSRLYLLLFALAGAAFLLDQKRIFDPLVSSENKTIQDIPFDIGVLLLILGTLIFVWDFIDRKFRQTIKGTGIPGKATIITLEGSAHLPVREYQSTDLGIMGKPNALIKENKEKIPVEIYPTSQNVQDRHIVRMVALLKLVEENEGQKPSHGILLLGKDSRKIIVKNTPERQRWLESILDEMRTILDGIPAIPSPSRYKCKFCDVNQICQHSAYKRN
jgi:CRISPR/Cas system-associated exonuclease Cas4 (RecB family)